MHITSTTIVSQDPLLEREIKTQTSTPLSNLPSTRLEMEIADIAPQIIGDTTIMSQNPRLQCDVSLEPHHNRTRKETSTPPSELPSKKLKMELPDMPAEASAAAAIDERMEAKPLFKLKEIKNAKRFFGLIKHCPTVEEVRANIFEGEESEDEDDDCKTAKLAEDVLQLCGEIKGSFTEIEKAIIAAKTSGDVTGQSVFTDKKILYALNKKRELLGVCIVTFQLNEKQKLICELNQIINFQTKIKGVGKALINQLFQICNMRQATSIELLSTPSAQSFYKHLGFTPLYNYEKRDDICVDDDSEELNSKDLYRFRFDLS